MKPRPSGKAGFCTPSRTRVAIVAIAAIVLLTVVTRPSPSVASVSAVDSGASKHRRQLEREEQQQLEGKLRAEEEAEGEGGSVEEAEADDDGHGSTDDTDMGQHAAAQVEAQDAAERGWGEEQAAEAGGGGGGGTGGGTNLRKQWGEGPSEYAAALAGCTDLACLTMAAQKPRYPGQFLFPSFFVVGWQKSATTSLFFHLRGHPQVAAAHTKEPEFFSEQCGYRPTHCPQDAQEEYIHRVLRLPDVLESQLTSLSAEASTHYGRNGALLASGIHKVFPWLRIIASVREPINRAISMLAHNLDLSSKGCLTRREVYTCLKKELPGLNYSEPWEAWLQAWPRTQLYLVQYENMTSEESGVQVLQDIKRFLHIDPNLPATVEDDGSAGLPTLSQHNTRAQHLQRKGELKEGEEPEGWPIKRRQYEELLDIVRPDAERLAKLVRQHGFADSKEWLENWEMQWQATLDTCDKRGNCMIFP